MEPPYLTRGETSNFRGPRPWGIGRIQAINIKADVNGSASHLLPHFPHQGDQRLHPAVFSQDHPEALKRWELKSRRARPRHGSIPYVPVPSRALCVHITFDHQPSRGRNRHPHFAGEDGRNGSW